MSDTLRVWVLPDDISDAYELESRLRSSGGREIVLRKLYFPPDSWQEVEK